MTPGASLQLEPRQQVLFVSDLHLLDDGDALTTQFLDWLRKNLQTHQPDWLILLGDVFEAWVGDDVLQDQPAWPALVTLLRQQAQAGLQIGMVHGNRDFLLGQAFCQLIGARLLPDPFVLIQASGKRWLPLRSRQAQQSGYSQEGVDARSELENRLNQLVERVDAIRGRL